MTARTYTRACREPRHFRAHPLSRLLLRLSSESLALQVRTRKTGRTRSPKTCPPGLLVGAKPCPAAIRDRHRAWINQAYVLLLPRPCQPTWHSRHRLTPAFERETRRCPVHRAAHGCTPRRNPYRELGRVKRPRIAEGAAPCLNPIPPPRVQIRLEEWAETARRAILLCSPDVPHLIPLRPCPAAVSASATRLLLTSERSGFARTVTRRRVASERPRSPLIGLPLGRAVFAAPSRLACPRFV